MAVTRKRTTTERGLGWSHQQMRLRLLAELKDGDPCARCASRGVYHPMYRALPARMLEVDDFPPRSVALRLGIEPEKHLSFRTCNRRHGAAISNAIQRQKRALGMPSRYDRW